MSLNKFMHPRNIYKVPPNFKELAIKYPEFRKHVVQDLSGKISLDFKDPAALRALTATLLKKDFDLDVVIPPTHLVPTVPQRLNYILWIEDLLAFLSASSTTIQGIDIGTGACCIYPLLGTKKNGWKFIATEINQESVLLAQENVANNNLQEKIEILEVDKSTTLEDVLKSRGESFDFCMCNPPFFHDKHDASWKKKSRTPRRPDPKATLTGEDDELVVEGGEAEFVKTIIQSSLKLQERVRIYTTMIGKKKNVKEVVNELLKCQITCFTTTEFCQGKTMRWGVAWTFLKNVDFKMIQQRKPQKPKPPLTYIIPSSITETAYTLEAILDKVTSRLKDLMVQVRTVSENKNSVHLHVRSNQNTWSHQRRKRRERERQKSAEVTSTEQILGGGKQNCNDSGDHQHHNNVESCVLSLPSTSNEGCSSQKRKLDSEDVESDKHHKVTSCDDEPDHWLLSCDLTLKQIGKNIALQMQCCHDMDSRDPIHQIMQFLKNNLK